MDAVTIDQMLTMSDEDFSVYRTLIDTQELFLSIQRQFIEYASLVREEGNVAQALRILKGGVSSDDINDILGGIT